MEWDAGLVDHFSNCPSADCPPADYGLVLASDAELLLYNAEPDADCPLGPLRGQATDSCGTVTLDVAACTGPNRGLPCVSIAYSQVEYLATGGERYVGSAQVSFDRASIESPNGILSGTWHTEPITAEGGGTVGPLGGRFVLCGRLFRHLHPCP